MKPSLWKSAHTRWCCQGPASSFGSTHRRPLKAKKTVWQFVNSCFKKGNLTIVSMERLSPWEGEEREWTRHPTLNLEDHLPGIDRHMSEKKMLTHSTTQYVFGTRVDSTAHTLRFQSRTFLDILKTSLFNLKTRSVFPLTFFCKHVRPIFGGKRGFQCAQGTKSACRKHWDFATSPGMQMKFSACQCAHAISVTRCSVAACANTVKW